ncbi:glutamyl-tRNA reductase [Beggiatoa leptomitoformis]|uniref:Glutamyl-tRNA reductase n=1 Tax=Beggiatoa leptomitoformis TaxID=288004 RepID=A0A2N9YCL8_9GAMM|nr:glutamyl-tRNA reductase [Beggiatoa leptomitoformis]ALG66500.1 glutamyl-tRNA reductase [Beggiatoa leptomitoformis]AUI68205.1 glutamyl-tRNA reductase [Beggiatoa leptomitoformis]
MQLYVVGLNHTTAPVAVREQVSFSPERLCHALHDLTQHELVEEAVIVSTCNRTELYCALGHDTREPVLAWLGRYHHITLEKLNNYLYTYEHTDAVRHLLRVASGLDSLILGEPQILGQIKTAYQSAREANTIGRSLGKLFEHSFSVAKQIRTDTAIGSSPVSVAFAAVRLAQQIFGDLQHNTALLIGAGETIELAARHLHEKNLGKMIVANRTLDRARNVAKEFGGYAITLEEISGHLAEADVVISSTASPVPILSQAMVKQAIKTRKHRPMFIVDIAVPRDVEESVSKVEDVYLYTVDDLNEVIQENLRTREQAARQAEEIIDTQVTHFIGWLKSLSAIETICDIRERAQDKRVELVAKAKKMLDNGKAPHDVIDYLAHTLTNTIIHTPCTQLRQASYNGRDDLVSAAQQLFQLQQK